MLRVVLDTNVIVSALLSPGGNPSAIVNAVLDGRLLFCYSAGIWAEYEEVLFRPKFVFARGRARLVLDTLKEIGFPGEPGMSGVPFADESDRKFYDLAGAAGAFLVTGNLKHYPDESFIVTPAEMALAILKSTVQIADILYKS